MNQEEKKEGLGQGKQQDQANEKLQNLTRRSLNAATGGAWNKARNAPIIGAAAKKAENKIADKVGNSKIGQKLINPTNHQKPENLGAPTEEEATKPNAPKNGDVGSRNLQKSLKNRVKNVFNFRKKKSPLNKGEDNSGGESNSEENTTENEATSPADDIIEKGKARIKVKIIIYGSIFLFAALLFFAILAAVFGIDISQQLPSMGSNTYGTSRFESVYEKGTTEYKNEIAYYEKLKKASEDYEKKNGEPLKTNYIHAVLLYVNLYADIDETKTEKSTIQINFKKMNGMIDTIVELMKPSDKEKTIDYEKNGEFYNNLKNDSKFIDYNKELLKERTMDDILNEMFDLAEDLDEVEVPDDTGFTDSTKVAVKNQSTSGKTETTTTTLSIKEYISDSIYASTDKISNGEMVKAYTITYSTNIVSENKKLTINSGTATASNALCSTKEGCSYNKNGELINGGGSQSSKNTVYYKGKYYYKTPLSDEEQKALNSNIDSVFGNVVVNTDGTYPNLDWSKLGGLGDGDYKAILNEAFGDDIKYKNVGEDSYITDGNYGSKQVKTSVIFYDQKDYSSYKFCGLKSSTIGGSGCGITSMAIVASTYAGSKKYDPVYMNNEAKKMGLCSYSGTAQAFFGREAKNLHYKYVGGTKYNKKLLNNVLNHLQQGHLVIAHMGAGHFTGGGHYMVLGGVDPQSKKVYVYDPNNRSNKSNRKTGNGWYSFNDMIVKEAYHFYIIWKG